MISIIRLKPIFKSTLIVIVLLSYISCTSPTETTLDFTSPPMIPLHDIDAVWSPDGLQIAYSHSSKIPAGYFGIKLLSVENLATTELGVNGEFPAWSPDSKMLAINNLTSFQLSTIDLESYSTINIPTIPLNFLYPSWYPSGDSLLSSVNSGSTSERGLWTIHISTGYSRCLLSANVVDPTWNSREDTILFIEWVDDIQYLSLVSYPSISVERITKSDDYYSILDRKPAIHPYFGNPSFHPNDTSLLFHTTALNNHEASIWIYDISTKNISLVFSGGLCPSWNLKGDILVYTKSVVYGANTSGNGYLWLYDTKSNQHTQITFHN